MKSLCFPRNLNISFIQPQKYEGGFINFATYAYSVSHLLAGNFYNCFLILGLKILVSKCDSYTRVLQMNPPLYFGGFIKEISGLFFAR